MTKGAIGGGGGVFRIFGVAFSLPTIYSKFMLDTALLPHACVRLIYHLDIGNISFKDSYSSSTLICCCKTWPSPGPTCLSAWEPIQKEVGADKSTGNISALSGNLRSWINPIQVYGVCRMSRGNGEPVCCRS